MSYGTVLLSELYKSGNFGQANTPVDQLHFTFVSISKKLYNDVSGFKSITVFLQ